MAVTKIHGARQIQVASVTAIEVNASIIIASGGNPHTGDQSMGNNKLTSVAVCTNPQDAANKAYVDAAAQGLDVKPSVRVATTANITLSGTQSIDGVAVVAGDRVLVKNQTAAQDNGIWVVSAGAWTRATDADVSAEVTAGMFTFVEEGTTNNTSGWILTTANPIVLGTTPLTFTQFSGGGTIAAGAGLVKTGSVIDVIGGDGLVVAADLLSVGVDGVTVGFDASSPKKVKVADGGIGSAQLAAAVAGNGLTGGAGSPLAVGGGDGLVIAADLVSVGVDNATIVFDASSPKKIKVADAGIGVAQLSSAVAGNGLTGGSPSQIAVGQGNGITVDADFVNVNLDTNAGLKFDGSIPKKVQVALDGTSLSVSALGLKVNPTTFNGSFVTRETPAGLMNSVNTTFTLAQTPVVGSEHVFFNGLLQEPGAGNDYTIAGAVITYAFGPAATDRLRVSYRV